MSEITRSTPTGEIYYGIVREKKKWVRQMAVVVAAFMIYFSIVQRMYLGIPLGILLILATLFRREYVVYDKGIELRYFMRFADHIDLWPWSDVTSVHRQDDGHSQNVQMHFGKGALTRTYIMTRKDSEKVMALARYMNPNTTVKDLPKEAPLTARPAPRKKKK